MNWLTKAIGFGEKIKRVLRKRPSKEEIENSDWTSCCKGPILKKDLENNLWICSSCGKHHRISPIQRFDIIFGKNNYEILKTPIPKDDPLEWSDTKSYKQRLKSIARDSHDMIYYISMLSTTGGKLKVSPKEIMFNYNKIKKINRNKNCVIGFGITEKTISKFKSADGLVVGSAICKEITRSLKYRQNPVTNVGKVVIKLKNKIS